MDSWQTLSRLSRKSDGDLRSKVCGWFLSVLLNLLSFIFGKVETLLENFFGIGLPSCAFTLPETFHDPTEVVSLFFADCGLTTVPDKIGSLFFSFFFDFLSF